MSSCEDRLQDALESTISDLKQFQAVGYGETELDRLGCFYDYGLCFDYVGPNTFGENEPYYRYQISWGGPQEEFRYYVNDDKHPVRIEFVFMDWFDGASVNLDGAHYILMEEIFYMFSDLI